MSKCERCDRCGAIADAIPDELPDNWRYLTVQVRGSAGPVTGKTETVICDKCDDELYTWFHTCAVRA